MPGHKAARLLVGLSAAIAVLGMAVAAEAQEKKIKIGVVYDLTGPLAGGGSELQYIGAKIMLDQYAKTGVEGYKIEAVYADAQSKPDVAINEAVRLIEQEKVDMLLGFYSSAQCVPVAARVEQLKKFMWITTCISSAVLEDRNLKYVFRPQASGDQFGLMSMDFIAQNSKAKFGKEPKDLRVAIIHEDGAYGVDVAKGNEAGAKKAGFNVVLKEGYSATAPDLSALVTKLKRARPDVIFHTGYNPDITLFRRQAREQGLNFAALVGHGAGYGVYEKLKEASATTSTTSSTPIRSRSGSPTRSRWMPNLPPVIKMVGEEFDKAKPGVAIRSAHVGMAASNTYVFLTDVLPRAIKKYGGVDPDALRKAALDVDIPEGGTMLGFGVKFDGEGQPMAGQNERAFPVVIQYIDDKSYVVWPKSQAQREAVLPLPKGTTFSTSRAQQASSGGPGVLAVDGLVKRFGGFTAVNNVSFQVEQGEILGLIGPNGSGKSTIFNMLSGTLAPTAGSILFDGTEIAGAAAASHHQQRHRPHLPDPAAVPPAEHLRERGAGRLLRPGPPQPRQGR